MSLSVPRSDAHAPFTTPALVVVGDAQIAYRKIGSGPPLLLLHGWPLHGATFRQMLPALAAHYTCYVIDFPGAGASLWTDHAVFGMGRQAEAAKAFAEKMGLTSYSIVSHDTGGTIGRQLAIIDANHVEKLVAIGTEIPHHRPPWIRFFQLVSYLPGADVGFVANLKSDKFLRSARGFGGCFSNLDLIKADFHRLFVQPMLDSAELRAGQRQRLRGIDWKLLDGLAEGHAAIRAPVLLLWGANDPVFPIEEAKKMIPQFKDARLISIPDAKLFVHEERPDDVARECLSFLLSKGGRS